MKAALVALVSSALLVPASVALAGEKADVTMPDTMEVAGKKLVLNGMGLREKAVFDVYVGGLYLESKSKDASAVISSKQVKRIHLQFKRDVDADDVVEAWTEGFQKNSGKEFESIGTKVVELCSWMADFKEGDTLTFTYVPDAGLTVTVKGKKKGVIPDDAFARHLFAVFFGKKPPSSDLKNGMLGLDD